MPIRKVVFKIRTVSNAFWFWIFRRERKPLPPGNGRQKARLWSWNSSKSPYCLFNLTFFPFCHKIQVSPDESHTLIGQLHKTKPQKQDGTDVPEKTVFSVSRIKPRAISTRGGSVLRGKAGRPDPRSCQYRAPARSCPAGRGCQEASSVAFNQACKHKLNLRSTRNLQ